MSKCAHKGCKLRWYDCHLLHRTPIVAEYEAAMTDDGRPHPLHVAEVRALHPNCDLVYV